MVRTRSSALGISFTLPCCWSASSAAETWPVASSSTADFRGGPFGARSHRVWLYAVRLPAVVRRGGPLRPHDAGGYRQSEARGHWDQAAKETRASDWCWQ